MSEGNGKQPKVWVIIPMHNFDFLTYDCIDNALKNAGMDINILVIDDKSDTPFLPKKSQGEKVKVLNLKKNLGFTGAVNVGLRALCLNYDYVMVLNNDTIPQPDFVKTMVDTYKEDKQIGLVGASRIQSFDPYLIGMWGHDLTTGLVAAANEDPEEPSQCIWIPFCCVMFSKHMVQTIGLLDEKMINHCSDNDYCLRAIFMDFMVVHQPKAKVFHHQSKTINSKGILPYEDQKIFGKKWFGPAMNEILDKIPINGDLNKWGRVGFKYETREEPGKILTP